MFTRCPQCNTVFRIYAEQLAQARGQVRCGICDQSFNSLVNLSESLAGFSVPAAEPMLIAQTAGEATHVEHDAPPPRTETPASEPSFEAPQSAAVERIVIADADHEAHTPPLRPLPNENAGFTAPWERVAVARQTASHEADVPAAHIVPNENEDDVPAVQALPDEPIFTPPPLQAESSSKTATPSPAQTERPLPDLGIIAAEPRRMASPESAHGWLATTAWAVTNIALIVVLLGQYAYFNRNDLSQYPELRPWLTQFCAVMPCNTPLQRDVSHINLTNRIVQSHPSRPNALLIDATLVNSADFPQPYPLLEIRFSDLGNQLVAGRRFRPSEYLPAGTSLQAGMPPHQPVHITLEIVDPGKDAVSFQFELL